MKYLTNQFEFIQFFSEETLASMELRGIIGGDGSGIKIFSYPDTGNGNNCYCGCGTPPTPPETKAVALDCGNGSYKFACDFIPH